MHNLVLLRERRRSVLLPNPVYDEDDHPTPTGAATGAVACCCDATVDPNGDDDDEYHHGEGGGETYYCLDPSGLLVRSCVGGGRRQTMWECDLSTLVAVDVDEVDDGDSDTLLVGADEGGEAPHPPLLGTTAADWFDATYLDEFDGGGRVACMSRAGHIATVDPSSDSSEPTATLVGKFDNGIQAARWSPDREVLVLFTHTLPTAEGNGDEGEVGDGDDHVDDETKRKRKDCVLIAMSGSTFEVLAETAVEEAVIPDPAGGDNRGGGDGDSGDPATVSISWRPDGTSLAVSSVDASDGVRRVRIYDFRADHHLDAEVPDRHRGENDVGVGGPLSLRAVGLSEDGRGRVVPNIVTSSEGGGCCLAWGGAHGELVAAVQQKRTRKSRGTIKIIFFEPNGLRHGDFALKNVAPKTDVVTGLSWNVDSDLLAVTILSTTKQKGGDVGAAGESDGGDGGGGGGDSGRVQLYHRSNYHWYLKHELSYRRTFATSSSRETGGVVRFARFDRERPHRLIVSVDGSVGDGGGPQALRWCQIRSYDFCWDVHVSPDDGDDGDGDHDCTAAVIDGSALNLTPLGRAVVPPPMFAASVELGSPVTGLCHVPSPSGRVGGDCDGDGGESLGGTDGPASVDVRGVVSMAAQLSDGTLCLLGRFPASSSGAVATSSSPTASSSGGGCPVPGYVPPRVVARIDLSLASSPPLDPSALRQSIAVGYGGGSGIGDGGTSLRLLAVSCACWGGGGSGGSGGSTSSSSPDRARGGDHLVEIDIAFGTSTPEEEEEGATSSSHAIASSVVGRIGLGGRDVLRLVSWSSPDRGTGGGRALVELSDGTLLDYDAFSSTVSPVDGLSFEAMPEPCPWIAILDPRDILSSRDEDDEEAAASDGKPLVVGLSDRYRLYCGERLVCGGAGASTFHLSKAHQYLCFVTLGSRSELRFLPLRTLSEWDPLAGTDEDVALHEGGYEPRSVERGSRLVAVVPVGPTVVMQLPRGNLEAVYPRALVLPFVTSLVRDHRYYDALDLTRRQRVDMNLIVDLDPSKFLDDAGVFVMQVAHKIDYLNLFLSCLFDNDITLFKYSIPLWFPFGSKGLVSLKKEKFDFSNKVNVVCERLREVMFDLERDESKPNIQEGHFLLPVLSSFAKQSPPKLEDALALIRENALSNKSSLLSEKTQSSIQYLAFLANYELLFDTALGMYDYELAKAVARHSQMDPKLYLPLLKRLNSLPLEVAMYEVDVKLGRKELALRHLVDAEVHMEEGDHFEKCMDLIEKCGLHRLGLELFTDGGQKRRCIMLSLGERLLTEGNGQAALSVFMAAEPKDIRGAKKAARMTGEWRTFFSLCRSNDENGGESNDGKSVKSFARDVAAEIASGRRGGSSTSRRANVEGGARILLDYCDDVDGAVDILLEGHAWTEARRVALLHSPSRSDLLSKSVEGAESFARTCLVDFEDRAEAFEIANTRYATVLKIRQRAKLLQGEAEAVNDDGGSLFSAASNVSNTSLRSDMSGSSSSSYSSVTSMSSVISAGATSAFSITSMSDVNKHKSKFNKIGRNQKKKKKTKKPKNKTRAGSVEELQSVISTMKANCVSKDDFLSEINETILFLTRVGRIPVARALFEGYEAMRSRIEESQRTRIAAATVDDEPGKNSTDGVTEGHRAEQCCIGCEQEVDALLCEGLDQALHDFFLYLGTDC